MTTDHERRHDAAGFNEHERTTSPYGHFEMFGDGTARHPLGGVADLCESFVDAFDLVTLQSPEIFAACLDDTVLAERFACLRQARLEYPSTCVEGVDDCGGV